MRRITAATRTVSGYDLMGITLSGLCMVHCLALALVMSLLPTVTPALPGDARVHRVLYLAVMGCGLTAFVRGYRRHRRAVVLYLMVPALGLLLAGALGVARLRAWEVGLSVGGSLLMVAAHGLNHSFCARCRRCAHGAARAGRHG
jgi:MerC mercury resistance protein